MNILQSCGSNSWGGLEMIAAQTAVKLQQRKHSIWFLAPPNSKLTEYLRKNNIKLLNLKTNNINIITSSLKLSRFLMKNKIDIIHTHHSHDLWTIIPATKLSRKKIKIFLTKHMGSWVSKKDIFHKLLYNNLTGVFCVSNYVKKSVLDTCAITNEKITILPNGIDISKFSSLNSETVTLRKELNIKEETILISIVGRITPGKGHEEFINAAEILLKEKDNLIFLIIGGYDHTDKMYKSSLEKLINIKNLNDKILFLGHRENINELLQEIDILSFPSHEESFGITLLEAMESETPIVASNKAGVLDIIQNMYNGILTEPKNSESHAKGIMYLLNHPEQKKEIVYNARKTVEEKFDLDKIIDVLENHYEYF